MVFIVCECSAFGIPDLVFGLLGLCHQRSLKRSKAQFFSNHKIKLYTANIQLKSFFINHHSMDGVQNAISFFKNHITIVLFFFLLRFSPVCFYVYFIHFVVVDDVF